jgi:hypothetical protein
MTGFLVGRSLDVYTVEFCGINTPFMKFIANLTTDWENS